MALLFRSCLKEFRNVEQWFFQTWSAWNHELLASTSSPFVPAAEPLTRLARLRVLRRLGVFLLVHVPFPLRETCPNWEDETDSPIHTKYFLCSSNRIRSDLKGCSRMDEGEISASPDIDDAKKKSLQVLFFFDAADQHHRQDTKKIPERTA